MKDYLALIVLFVGVSAYQSRESVDYLCNSWLPLQYKQRLEPLVRKLPHIELEVRDGIEVRVTRGRAKDI